MPQMQLPPEIQARRDQLLREVKACNGEVPQRWTWPTWLRRKTIFDPPTALDRLLESPLRIIVIFLYSILLRLRGAPFAPPPNRRPIKVVCISDTHTNTPVVPDGDLLIHAGDLTNEGTVAEIQAQVDWLANLPHRHKVVVIGNHDSWFDERSRKAVDKGDAVNGALKVEMKGVHYLQDSSIKLSFEDGRTLNVYGAADIPQCGGSDFAFQYNRSSHPWTDRIPPETDVLITHTPPRYHLDLNLGCAGLLSEIWKVKARLHVFGHVHSGHGREPVFWDASQASYERLMARKGGFIKDVLPSWAWLEFLKMLLYGAKGILWQRLMVGVQGANGGLLVNAAMVWRTTTELGNQAEVVEL